VAQVNLTAKINRKYLADVILVSYKEMLEICEVLCCKVQFILLSNGCSYGVKRFVRAHWNRHVLEDGLLPVEFFQFSEVKDCTISETVGRGDLKASVHRDRKGSNPITTILWP